MRFADYDVASPFILFRPTTGDVSSSAYDSVAGRFLAFDGALGWPWTELERFCMTLIFRCISSLTSSNVTPVPSLRALASDTAADGFFERRAIAFLLELDCGGPPVV